MGLNKYDREKERLLLGTAPDLPRQNRHIVRKLADGQGFVESKTPSDQRSSVRSLAQLKRLLRTEAESQSSSAPPARDKPHGLESKTRFVIPNRAARNADNDFQLRFECQRSSELIAPKRESAVVAFGSIEELLAATSLIDDYWALDFWSRLRILKKFAGYFAKPALVTARFNLFNVLKADETFTQSLLTDFFNRRHFDRLWMLQYAEWRLSGIPALSLRDPKLGSIVVDVAGFSVSAKVDNVVVIPATFDQHGTFVTGWPVWHGEVPPVADWKGSQPDQVLAYTFFNKVGMKKWGVHYGTPVHWEGQARTRAIETQLINLLIGQDD